MGIKNHPTRILQPSCLLLYFIHVRRRESFRRENDHRLQESGVLRSSELVWTEEGYQIQGGPSGVGYKGSTEAGSAPKRRDGKSGYVYSLGLRNGKANVDEYSPIYSPDEFKSDGDKYEGNLLYWAATLAGVIGSGALAIYLTSAL